MEIVSPLEVTRERAQEIALDYARQHWGDLAGTPDAIVRAVDDGSWFVEIGAREWLRDDDPSFVLMSGAAHFVDRQTGELITASHVLVASRLDKMLWLEE